MKDIREHEDQAALKPEPPPDPTQGQQFAPPAPERQAGSQTAADVERDLTSLATAVEETGWR